MSAVFFLQGFAVGFSIAAPVGPIGVLCLRRSLAEGAFTGLCVGLGAATADAFYGAIAGFGITAVAGVFIAYQVALELLGGLFLCFLGVKTALSRPAEVGAPERGRTLLTAYTSTVLLTLTNPATIISFIPIFAGLGLGTTGGDPRAAATLVAGVFLGSACWWLFLSNAAALLRTRIDQRWMRAINWFSGAVLVAFGGYALWRGLRS
jgi:threonine/homoserine/homoserine lactone efflux protein